MSESNQADSQLPQVLVENPMETSSVSDWCGQHAIFCDEVRGWQVIIATVHTEVNSHR